MISSRLESPVARRSAAQVDALEDRASSAVSSLSNSSNNAQDKMPKGSRSNNTTAAGPSVPLTTSRLANQQSPLATRQVRNNASVANQLSLKKLQHRSVEQKVPVPNGESNIQLDENLNKLIKGFNEQLSIVKENSPAKIDLKEAMEPSTNDHLPEASQAELLALKMELGAAHDKIRELAQQKATEQSNGHVANAQSDTNFQYDQDTRALMDTSSGGVQSHINPTERPSFTDRLFAASPVNSGRFQGPWRTGIGGASFGAPHPQPNAWPPAMTSPWSTQETRVASGASSRFPPAPQPQRPNMFHPDAFENEHFFGNSPFEHGFRRTSMPNSRPSSATGSFYNPYSGYPSSSSPQFSPPMSPIPFQPMNNQQAHFQYHGPIGSPLSPTAMEFSGNTVFQDNGPPHGNPWNNPGSNASTSTYMAPMEPMNYRRLLERNMSCDWSYIVDKIVCSNDQQASIFLQQKLKVATPEQKYELVEAIVKQAYPLMVNRFGNFLVQRCFEHGTPEQVIAIAKAIQGRVINLSTDAFGCHVVQKAFDVVPDDYKAVMVHELLRNIPETVIHRYACHVWQKLFELRWADSPPQIMKYVNEALRGMWHEVALGETGSLVVQNIFENCLEEDKRPCINEVLASIDIVSHGQFGNWCIQHICEHGAPADKSRAIEHVLRFSTEYSTDQFASKVVEKCLKVGGPEFLDRYLEKVCESRSDRPRMPLIDISADQYGNYLIQYILIHANPQHRDIVSNHVRKHIVSLRGSKFGSRVAMLCGNPGTATRPGPPMGMQMSNRFIQNMTMNGYHRQNPTGPFR